MFLSPYQFDDIVMQLILTMQVAEKNEKRNKGSATHVAEFDVVMQVCL